VTHVVVLSDTHVRRGSGRRLPDAAYDELRRADVVLHAGDVVARELLAELAAFAPVHAVLGNNDHELVGELPEARELTIGGVRVAMVHDSGPRAGRAARLRRRFPEADVVVFGHSHEPQCEEGEGGQLLVNPGSPTERRLQPAHTLAVLDLHDGRVEHAAIVTLTQASASA
jgi:putative phosphoesterase